jgi:signal peptidase I
MIKDGKDGVSMNEQAGNEQAGNEQAGNEQAGNEQLGQDPGLGLSGDPGVSPVVGKKNGMHSWLRDVLISVSVSAFIIVFLYQPVRVEGTSMLPMLQDQDRLFINKMAYHVGDIHRGDVVVFLYPHDHEKSYIKRVIALPGDELKIDHGQVYVNGTQVVEKYVPSRFTDDRSQPEMIVPEHEYFVMGDHRSISSDSRDFGPVDRELIYGKAAFVYWPMDQAGVVR